MLDPKIVEIDFPRDDQNDEIESIAYQIHSYGADLTFRELITMYQEDELAKPDIQRRYVWTKKEASRFIESILLGLPVPSIFLAEYGSQKLIIDGYQRIMSVYDFIHKQKFANEPQVFKLINSDAIVKKWRGKSFIELEIDDQRRLRSTPIHAIIFSQQEPKQNYSSLYQIFERINTGGQKLTPQEIRNCIYQGLFNKKLIDLNENQQWRQLLHSDAPDIRMADIEVILRFFALSQEKILTMNKHRIGLKTLENEFMKDSLEFDSDTIDKHAANFENCISFITSTFGNLAFCNYSIEKKQFTQKLHAAIFDSLMIATKYIIDNGLKQQIPNNTIEHWETVRSANKDYREYITEQTTLCDHIRGRVNIILKEVYGCEYQFQKI